MSSAWTLNKKIKRDKYMSTKILLQYYRYFLFRIFIWTFGKALINYYSFNLAMKTDNVSKWCWNTKVLVKLLMCKIRASLFPFAEDKPWVMLKHSNLTISKPNTWVPGSLWRRANARKVSFETLHGRQFTLSKLIIPNYIKSQPQLFSFWSVVNKIVLMTRYAKLLWTFHDNKRCMMQ